MQLFIPNKLKIGYQARKDTYTVMVMADSFKSLLNQHMLMFVSDKNLLII